MASSVSNKNDASALHNSVLPTPVGPRNKNDPFGRSGSDKPARDLRTALDTAITASCWPMTRSCKEASMRNNLSFSPSSILEMGIPVHLETTSAISSSVTLFRSSFISIISACAAISSCFSKSGIRPYCSSDIWVKSPSLRATSISNRARSNSSLIF